MVLLDSPFDKLRIARRISFELAVPLRLVDHIPVHHTNEIAQSEAAFDKSLAKYWIHSEHLLENGYSTLDFRYLCLSARYRSKLDFSYESLDAAKSARKRINDAYNSAGSDDTDLNFFDEALSEDLDTPKALAFVFDNLGKLSRDNFEKIDEVLGILEKVEIPEEVRRLVEEREETRKNKDFEKSDQLRSEIEEKGFLVEDLAGKTVVKKK